jgi:hypothetical protein
VPETAGLLSGDALAQIAVLALCFLYALYFVIKKAVSSAIRTERSRETASQASPSIDHHGG